MNYINRKLSNGAEKEGTLDSLYRTLNTLGISINQIDQAKVTLRRRL